MIHYFYSNSQRRDLYGGCSTLFNSWFSEVFFEETIIYGKSLKGFKDLCWFVSFRCQTVSKTACKTFKSNVLSFLLSTIRPKATQKGPKGLWGLHNDRRLIIWVNVGEKKGSNHVSNHAHLIAQGKVHICGNNFQHNSLLVFGRHLRHGSLVVVSSDFCSAG